LFQARASDPLLRASCSINGTFKPGLPDGTYMYFHTKNPNRVYFRGPWNGKCLRIFYGHLVHTLYEHMTIVYILCSFGRIFMFCYVCMYVVPIKFCNLTSYSLLCARSRQAVENLQKYPRYICIPP
jgi:hypothetical protein